MAADKPRVRWPEFSHVIFDCDSTLTTVEGIDVLADALGLGAEVAEMTDAAMAGEIDLSEVYGARMALLQPSKQAVADLRTAYKRNVVDDAAAVVQALRHLDLAVYVVSGGLAGPVEDLAVSLGIAADNVHAVVAEHDSLSGEWWKAGHEPVDEEFAGFAAGALTRSHGKIDVIRSLLEGKPGRSMLVGDGASDLEAQAAIDLFVGFGGVVERPHVAAAAPVYVTCRSLAPVLPLAAGPGGRDRLTSADRAVFDRGVGLIAAGDTRFSDEAMRARLHAALEIEGTLSV